MKKSHTSLLFCFSFIFIIFINECFLWYFEPDNTFIHRFRSFKQSQSFINRGLTFYTKEKIHTLALDEAFLFFLIQKSQNKKLPENFIDPYKKDPLSRLFDMSTPPIHEIVFHRNDVSDTSLKHFSYTIDPPYNTFLEDPWDDVLFKTLHCDASGYDEKDFSLLLKRRDMQGNYADTHVLLALLFLEKNNCFPKEKIQKQKEMLIQTLILAEDQDPVFSDIFAERAVFIFWSGYGNTVKKEWIEKIQQNMSDDSGWRYVPYDIRSSAHTTGLALLALIYDQEKILTSIFSLPKNTFFYEKTF